MTDENIYLVFESHNRRGTIDNIVCFKTQKDAEEYVEECKVYAKDNKKRYSARIDETPIY